MTDPLLIDPSSSALLDPSSSALLVMDYQIDVLEKFMAPADSTEVLSVLPKLLAAARSADMLVIYVVVSFRPGYPEVSPRNAGFFCHCPKRAFSGRQSGNANPPRCCSDRT
jgi:nicotinamidase-related amidase